MAPRLEKTLTQFEIERKGKPGPRPSDTMGALIDIQTGQLLPGVLAGGALAIQWAATHREAHRIAMVVRADRIVLGGDYAAALEADGAPLRFRYIAPCQAVIEGDAGGAWQLEIDELRQMLRRYGKNKDGNWRKDLLLRDETPMRIYLGRRAEGYLVGYYWAEEVHDEWRAIDIVGYGPDELGLRTLTTLTPPSVVRPTSPVARELDRAAATQAGAPDFFALAAADADQVPSEGVLWYCAQPGACGACTRCPRAAA